jgi:hypothetical protein
MGKQSWNSSKATGAACLTSLLIVGGVIGFAGCALFNEPTPLRVALATERQDNDVIPETNELSSVVMESSRLLGSRENINYYLTTSDAEPKRSDGICIVMLNVQTSESMAGCGYEGGNMSSWGQGFGGARLLEPGSKPAAAGWTELTEFLLVNPGARSGESG